MTNREKENYKKYYEITNVLGNGGFGIVCEGKDKENNEFRAIKTIDLKEIVKRLMDEYVGEDLKKNLDKCINGFITEFNNMKICSEYCENSVKCYEYFNDEDNFVIIMELCDIDLSKILTNKMLKNGKGFNSKEIIEILEQLNKAFKVMKENNIIHRDLKLENILVKYDKENKKYNNKIK